MCRERRAGSALRAALPLIRGIFRVFKVQVDAAVADVRHPGVDCSSAEVPYAALQYNT